MCEEIVKLIVHWDLSPFAVLGWVVSGLLAFGLYALWKAQQNVARETRQWLREDSRAKESVMLTSERVAVSLRAVEAALSRIEALLAARRRNGAD